MLLKAILQALSNEENQFWELENGETVCGKNEMFPLGTFVKDPSTSLRISLGGSDAARTAQDVLFRD
jgi:hypothetical protein